MARIRVSVCGAPQFRGTDAEKLARRAARAAFSHFGYSFRACVDITLTDDVGIRKINSLHRKVDRPTDVLSFPMERFKRGRPCFETEGGEGPEKGVVLLGDIVLSLERARAQSAEYGHSFSRECAYLVVHSMLHLLGFDHLKPRQKACMREKEEQIMSLLGLERM